MCLAGRIDLRRNWPISGRLPCQPEKSYSQAEMRGKGEGSGVHLMLQKALHQVNASSFHPAVADWFAGSFAAPTPAQAEAWAAIKAGRNAWSPRRRVRARRSRRFSRRSTAWSSRARGRPQGRDAGRLRFAAQGALERYPDETWRRRSRAFATALAARGSARRRDPHLGPDGRHAVGRARPHAPAPAAYRGDHAGVALRPARLGIRPSDAGDDADRDRRRDSRRRAEQTRHPSLAFARAARRALCGVRSAADRALGDAEADRDGGAVSGRAGAAAQSVHRHRQGLPARPRARHRSSRSRHSRR